MELTLKSLLKNTKCPSSPTDEFLKFSDSIRFTLACVSSLLVVNLKLFSDRCLALHVNNVSCKFETLRKYIAFK